MKVIGTCIALFLVASVAGADDLVVDWDGKGLQGAPPLAIDAVPQKTTEGVTTLVLDPELSWRPTEGFTPDDSKTGDFSAGLSASVGASPAIPDILKLEDIPGGGRIHILLRGSVNDPPQMRGLVVFTKAHFLNGASDASRTIGFDDQSLLSFLGILDGCAPEARWVVRDGEVWYVSEATLTAQQSYQTPELREMTDPGSQKWAEYNADSTPFEVAPPSFNARQFENITAVGIWFDSYGPRPSVGGTSFSRVALDRFQARMMQK